MIVTKFTVEEGGREFRFRPLTVRERMGLVSAHVEREKANALAIVKATGICGKDAATFVAEAVGNAQRVSALVMDCFTLEGAIAVLKAAAERSDDVDDLAALVEPGKLSVYAARCLNIDTTLQDKSGNG